MAIRVAMDLPIGAQIGVEFTPQYTQQPMSFRCFVRNRDGDHYGVEFITENDVDYRKAEELRHRLAAMNSVAPET